MHMYPILYCVCLLLLIQLAALQLYLHTILQASLGSRLPPSFSVAGKEPGNEAAMDFIEELCLSLARLFTRFLLPAVKGH